MNNAHINIKNHVLVDHLHFNMRYMYNVHINMINANQCMFAGEQQVQASNYYR